MAQDVIPGDFNINAEVDVESIEASAKKARNASLKRLARYTLLKAVALIFTVAVGVYITVIIANMGGYLDQIRLASIREGIITAASLDQEFRQLPVAERNSIIEQRVQIEIKRLGLDRPFFIRSLEFLWNAMTLNLGFSQQLTSDSGSRMVRNIILERLPSTLVLFGTANLLLFFLAVSAGLSLSRRYGSFADKLVLALAPLSSAPGWFYGIFLILIFAALLKVLPFGGMVSAPPPDNPFDYFLSLLRHMILPVSALLISAIFFSTYSYRTFFLIYSSEDYVEMAKAKGLPNRMIERRYILRPTLPNIITDFALLLISLWTGAIILETVFNWPGIGQLYNAAIGANDIPVIIANTVIYGYLLALTVFLLDFIYALVDPRVRVGGGERRQ